jgi:dienelactone hydrolase
MEGNMTLFRRMMRGLFFLAGVAIGLITLLAAFLARRLINPPRPPLWATPDELGMAYDNVLFPALDGIRLSGWFIPAPANSQRKGATIIIIHGWTWNRMGTPADDILSRLTGSTPVELLRLALSLHQDGFNVFMFDGRNHGESASVPPFTFGVEESKDVLGAIEYVKSRAEADPGRIGVIGFSAGGNSLLYTLPQTRDIQAAIAVQPTTPTVFASRYGRHILSVLSYVALPIAEMIYKANGGRPFAEVRPGSAATHAGNVQVLYIQGNGDPWGSAADVAQMAASTPQASGPLFVDATHRYDGYQYLINNPKIATAFFEQHLPE